MSRQIICLKCFEGRTRGVHDSDGIDPETGWTERVLFLSNSHIPAQHGISLNGVFNPLNELRCDLCNEDITGQIVVAVSRIPPEREMREWEHEYGKVMTAEEVEAYRKLAAAS